jgi:hypothetical protein
VNTGACFVELARPRASQADSEIDPFLTGKLSPQNHVGTASPGQPKGGISSLGEHWALRREIGPAKACPCTLGPCKGGSFRQRPLETKPAPLRPRLHAERRADIPTQRSTSPPRVLGRAGRGGQQNWGRRDLCAAPTARHGHEQAPASCTGRLEGVLTQLQARVLLKQCMGSSRSIFAWEAQMCEPAWPSTPAAAAPPNTAPPSPPTPQGAIINHNRPAAGAGR